MLKLFYTEVKPHEERLKAGDLHNAAHECLRQGVLSCLTGLYTEKVRAVKITLGTGEHGKPYLTSHPALEISLSHAGHIAMCAISEQTIGVDVQDHRKMTKERMMQLAARFYAPEEQEMLSHTASEEARRLLFFRIWTAKEACAKYTGKGLAEDFTAFYADFTGMCVRKTGKGDILGYLTEPLSLPGYSCTICTENPIHQVDTICLTTYQFIS